MASDEDFHDPLSYNFSGLVYRLVVFDKRSVPDHMEPVNALLGCLYGHPKAIEIKTAARISAIIATYIVIVTVGFGGIPMGSSIYKRLILE
jgi:hypothetical protein